MKAQSIVIGIILGLLTLGQHAQGAVSESVEYRFDRMAPPLAQPWNFQQLSGIAIAQDGSMWITDATDNRIKHLDTDGRIIGKIEGNVSGDLRFYDLRGITLAADDSVWVINGSGQINHFKADGSFIARFYGAGSAITAATDGSVWTVESAYGGIKHFAADGKLISQFESACSLIAQAPNTRGGARAADGSLWVTNSWDDNVQHLNAEGNLILKFGSSGTNPGQFRYPMDIALAADGSVWVVDTNNNRLQHFKSDGSFIEQIVNNENEPEPFMAPHDIEIAKDGSLWVTNSKELFIPVAVGNNGNNRILHLTAEGDFIAQFGSKGNQPGQTEASANTFYRLVLADDGSIFVFESGDTIRHLSADGTFIELFEGNAASCAGSGIGQLNKPQAIALAADGSVWVADTGNHRIQHFSAKGSLIAMVGSQGADAGQFQTPSGIALAPDGSVWVVDSDKHRIQHFQADGRFIAAFGSNGPAAGQFLSPNSLALAADGSVWVADTGNRRIQHLTGEGRFIAQFGRYRDDAALENAFDFPEDLLIAADGSIRVGNKSTPTVLHLNAEGEFIEQLLGLTNTEHFPISRGTSAADGGSWKADVENHRIQYVKTDGGVIAQVGGAGREAGRFETINRIETAADGSVWAMDSWTDLINQSFVITPFRMVRLQHFTPAGQFTGEVRFGGYFYTGTVSFTTAPDGSAWLTDSQWFTDSEYPNRIRHYDTAGRLIEQFGDSGEGIGQFNGLSGIARSADGALWVLDAGNRRLQKFVPNTQTDSPADYDERHTLLYLRDIDVAGLHYHASLHYENGLLHLLTLNPTSNRYGLPASFDAATSLLSIPPAHAFGLDYQAVFKKIAKDIFQLQPATPK